MTVSFVKTGKAAQSEIVKAEAKAEEAKAGYVNRFWMPDDAEAVITFLDGDLEEGTGLLTLNQWYEHQVHMNGSWKNWFVCVAEFEPCPVCEGGDKSSLVHGFTVIDHSEFVDTKGNHRKDERRLYIAKQTTVKQLQMMATKREGLTGCTFEVSRVGDKAANVGNMFDFVGKQSLAVLKKKYADAKEGPFVYTEVAPYREAATLRKLGFGSTVVGSEAGVEESDGGVDYAKAL